MYFVSQVALPLVLAFIMFSMGITLVWDDFKRVATFPKPFIVGSLLQLVSLPVLAFLLASLWLKMGSIEPAFAVGLVIVAACPGGVASNLMTHISGGDTALSISLTAIISLLTTATIPLIVNLGLSHFMGEAGVQLPLAKTVAGIFAITTVPVLLGMLLKKKAPDWSRRTEPVMAKISGFFLFLIVIVAIGKYWPLLIANFLSIGPLTLGLNIMAMILAYGVAQLLSLNRAQKVAITFECGLQNGATAIFVSLTLLKSQEMMIPCGVYALLMVTTGSLLMLYFAKTKPKELLS